MLGIIKHDGVIFSIADNNLFKSDENNYDKDNLSIWTPKGCKSTILASSNDYYKVTFLKNANLVEVDNVSQQYLMKYSVPKLIDLGKKHKLIKPGKFETLDMSLTVVTGDRAYFIGAKGAVREVGDFEFFTADSTFISACYEQLIKKMDMEQALLVTLYFYFERQTPIVFPISVMNNKTMELKNYSYDDLNKAYKRYMNKEAK